MEFTYAPPGRSSEYAEEIMCNFENMGKNNNDRKKHVAETQRCVDLKFLRYWSQIR